MNIDLDKLKAICLDFFKLTGMGFSLWDEDRRVIFSFPDDNPPFCKAVRDNQELHKKCQISDKVGLDTVYRTKQPFIYTCHMGLTEAIVPILESGDVIGYLMLGQSADEDGRGEIIKRIENSVSDPQLKQTLLEKHEEINKTSQNKIKYCINILGVLIDYMNMSYVISRHDRTVVYRAERYVSENMARAVLPKDICRHVGVSTNTLYKEIRKHVGVSPTVFIRKIKLTEAKRLLSASELSVSEIAERVGIPDANYFIRVFTKEEGVSPLRFRKQRR